MSRPKEYRIGAAFVFVWLFLLISWPSASAQSFQFLPEADAYYRFKPNVRFSFQVKDTRESGSSNQFEIGPTIDLFVKPIASIMAR